MLPTAKFIYVILLLLTLYVLFRVTFILSVTEPRSWGWEKWSEIVLNWGALLTLKGKSELLVGIILSRNKFLSGTKK